MTALHVLMACLMLTLLGFPPGSALARPPAPGISEISGTIRGGEARVRFTLVNAFTPEMVEALKSGIEITFKTTVEVERVYRNWFNLPMGRGPHNRPAPAPPPTRVTRPGAARTSASTSSPSSRWSR